ncbi:mitochondrial inner membrane protein OXA1L-like [Branchiostoma floridae]|uniref:Mitochondrial inner membrane protein OXA1L-like n=1 Tax=Branchiostoma floridae TaxID=7739 RepID=A0A9J7LAJ0_BRAFL|nr:mitochondrial inner membrane protein OXA1L-like [Branchiostoma floridae]
MAALVRSCGGGGHLIFRNLGRQASQRGYVAVHQSLGPGHIRSAPRITHFTDVTWSWLRRNNMGVLGMVGIRYNSTDVERTQSNMQAADTSSSPPDAVAPNITSEVPPAIATDAPLTEVTPVPFETPTAHDIMQAAAETGVDPSLTELGLGGWSPICLLQSSIDMFHSTLHLPWWASIVCCTLLARSLMFPLIVKGQKNAINLNNVMPQIQKMNEKINEARTMGNKFEVAHQTAELQAFMKKHGVNPLKNFLVPLVQMPVFISFFVGLRRMATLPIMSMATGGIFWFTDLTASDPYFILPVMTSITMLTIIELGSELGVENPQMKMMKNVMRVVSLMILPLTASFPTAIFTYWMTSNTFTIAQISLLKVPAVRQWLKMPNKIQHDPSSLKKSEGFIKGMKSGWKNANLANEVENRQRRAALRWKEAGTGPVPQTFTYDPTKQTPAGAHGIKTKGTVRKK